MKHLSKLLALSLVMAASAHAEPISVPNSFADGDLVSAATMNANFSALLDGTNAHDVSIEANAALVAENGTAIEATDLSVTELTARVLALETALGDGGDAFADLEARVVALENAPPPNMQLPAEAIALHATLVGDVARNVDDISAAEDDIASNMAAVASNSSDIEDNAGAIADNAGVVAVNGGRIQANSDLIALGLGDGDLVAIGLTERLATAEVEVDALQAESLDYEARVSAIESTPSPVVDYLELSVAADGTGDFESIQAAIDSTRTTVFRSLVINVAPGTYRSDSVIGIVDVPGTISIVGRPEDPGSVILRHAASGAIYVANSDVHLKGVRLLGNPQGEPATGLVTTLSGNITASDIQIREFSGGCVGVFQGSQLSMIDGDIRDCSYGVAVNAGGRLFATTTTIENMEFEGLSVHRGGFAIFASGLIRNVRAGVYVTTDSFASVRESHIDVTSWHAVYALAGGTVVVRGSEISNAANTALQAHQNSMLTISSSNIHDNDGFGISNIDGSAYVNVGANNVYRNNVRGPLGGTLVQ